VLGGGGGGLYCKPASRTEPVGIGDPPSGFLAVPTSTQRAGGQRIIGYFSTMRMTIYLLDGCPADYVIIKNNFLPFPCIGAISNGFPDWITGKHTPLQDHGKYSSGLWMLRAGVGDRNGRGWGYGKTVLHNII